MIVATTVLAQPGYGDCCKNCYNETQKPRKLRNISTIPKLSQFSNHKAIRTV